MTPEMWEERIVECYKNYKNMFPEEAKMKYLAFAQVLIKLTLLMLFVVGLPFNENVHASLFTSNTL